MFLFRTNLQVPAVESPQLFCEEDSVPARNQENPALAGERVQINLQSGVLFSEERESIATRESAVWKRFSRLTDRQLTTESRVAFISRSSEKRTPDRRLGSNQ